MQPLKSSKKKWTKLLREVGETNTSSNMEIQESRRPGLESSDLSVTKKKRVNAMGGGYNENIQVVAGLQYHQPQ